MSVKKNSDDIRIKQMFFMLVDNFSN